MTGPGKAALKRIKWTLDEETKHISLSDYDELLDELADEIADRQQARESERGSEEKT